MNGNSIRFMVFVLAGACFGQPVATADQPPAPLPRAGRVLVVANTRSMASLELARRYCEARQLPPANLLRIPIDATVQIAAKPFEDQVLTPLRERLSRLGSRVDYIVLMRDVPYRVDKRSAATAIMFDGLGKIRPFQSYFSREEPFEACIPYGGVLLHPTTMISGFTYQDAAALIDRADERYETRAEAGVFYFCEGAGARGVRNPQIEPAMRALQRLGARTQRVPSVDLVDRRDVIAQFTGHTWLKLDSNTYLPGSIIDNVTSFGGCLLEKSSQMSILACVNRGVGGAYGTVSEPTNSLTRWANLALADRYARGFNLAEAYLQSIRDWQFGILVGDPLTAPFAKPGTVAVALDHARLTPAGSARLTVTAREGAPGNGIAWVEGWLNDQRPLFGWTPSLPERATIQLALLDGEKTIYERQEVMVAPTALPQALAKLSIVTPGRIEVAPCGKRGTRLLVRWAVRDAEARPRTARVSITQNGQTHSAQADLFVTPILARIGVVDFGRLPPVTGDEFTITVDGEQRTARTRHGEALPDLVTRLAGYLRDLPSFGADGGLTLHLKKSAHQDPTYEIWFVPRNPAVRGDVPVTFAFTPVDPAATPVKTQTVSWQLKPLGAVAECVITPRVPTPSLTFTLQIPANKLVPGPNELLVQVGTPDGQISSARETLTLATGETGLDDTFRLGHATLDSGEALMALMTPAEPRAEAFPHLVVDGRPICSWQAGARLGRLDVRPPLIEPGEHVAWIEWFAASALADPLTVSTPLARSNRATFFVRRPLGSGVTVTPRRITAGKKAQVTINGPYLHGDVLVLANGNALRGRRMARDGRGLIVDVDQLAPGTYTLELLGNLETENKGAIGELTIMRPPPPEQP